MTSGNDQVLEIDHQEFDDAGSVTKSHNVEMNHKETNGLTLGGTADYVRSTVYRWHDDANRTTTAANYGSGNGTSGVDDWKKESVPTYSTAPTASTNYVLVTEYEYNSDSGELEIERDPENVETKTLYDDLGRTAYEISNYKNFTAPSSSTGGTDKSEDQVVKFAYDGLDQITTLTAMDANGDGNTSDNQDTTYEYKDNYDASFVTKTTYPDAGAVTMTFDLDGLVNTRTDQRGVVMDYSYKPYPGVRLLEWEKATTIPSGVDKTIKSIKRLFDSQGRVDKITSYADTSGSTVKNQIDYTYHTTVPGGRISYSYQDHNGATSGSSPHVRYGYDTSASSSIFSDGTRLQWVRYPSTKYVYRYYDGTIADRLHRVNRLRGNHSGAFTNLAEYEYSGAKRLVTTEYPTPSVVSRYDSNSSGDGVYERFDKFGRIKAKDWRKSSTIKDQFNYTYDYAGNRKTRDIPTAVYSADILDQKYTYDSSHRLENAEEGKLVSGAITGSNLKFEQEWALDALGNWSTFKQDDDGVGGWNLNQARTHNDANELTHIAGSTSHVACDAAGNMTKIPVTGSWTTSDNLTYDAWNRLVSVNSGYKASYKYDGLHRRIEKYVYDGGQTYHYYYNTDWQVLEVRLNSETGTKMEQNVWHPHYVDALAVRYYDDNSDGDYTDTDETEFALQDANFNVTSLVNTSGTVIERYTYSAYGQLQVRDGSFGTRTASSFANPYTYTGRRFDNETGLYYYRNRYYDSQLGRFVNRDPILYWGSQWNLYQYVNGRSVVGLDPFGLVKMDDKGNIVTTNPQRSNDPNSTGVTIYTNDGKPVTVFTDPRPGYDSNCHGKSMTGGQCWIEGPLDDPDKPVREIIEGDDYAPVERDDAKPGDICFFTTKDGDIVHSTTIVDPDGTAIGNDGTATDLDKTDIDNGYNSGDGNTYEDMEIYRPITPVNDPEDLIKEWRSQHPFQVMFEGLGSGPFRMGP